MNTQARTGQETRSPATDDAPSAAANVTEMRRGVPRLCAARLSRDIFGAQHLRQKPPPRLHGER